MKNHKEIRRKVKFLVDVGLNYLSLDRSAETPREVRLRESASKLVLDLLFCISWTSHQLDYIKEITSVF